MNERIEKLAFEAGLKWKAQPPHYTNSKSPIDFPVSANRDLENFAELIVRECANIVSNKVTLETNDDYLEGFHRAQQVLWQDINKHFGV